MNHVDPLAPCLVGTGRRTWHPGGDAAPEPLDMWVEVARRAAADVGATVDVLAAIDDLSIVHCQAWAYDDPAARCAEGLGLRPGRRDESILAGTSPQRLLDAAATRMLAGDTSVALVVGAEALATRKPFDRAGETPPWSFPHPTPPLLPVDLDEWYLPTEMRHGILPAWLTFALLEQARWAERGASLEGRSELGRLMERLHGVAANNPEAWFQAPAAGADELCTPSASNRMVATPYTKRMTAFIDVDMAAANLMVTHEFAEQWGVPPERRVYLRGWGFARDAVHIGARRHLGSSPAMAAATGEALKMSQLTVDDLDVFDLYSCFGSAVQFATDALGITVDDPRPLSQTGGLAYHGGPSSNYMGHSISHLVDHLRANPGATGLATGVGMHMTKHVAGVWSTTPGPVERGHDHGAQRWSHGSDGPGANDVEVTDEHSGPATVLAASVIHASNGAADHAVAICELPDDRRCYALTRDSATVAAIGADHWVGAAAHLTPTGDGTNELKL